MRAMIAGGITALVFLPLQISMAADKELRCPSLEFCYCVNPDFDAEIRLSVDQLRTALDDARKAGKLTAYISIPISGRGGGYSVLNLSTAGHVKEQLEERFGRNLFFALSPSQAHLNDLIVSGATVHATGSDYMYMWTQVLAGESGKGERLDMVYFVGPGDFARELHLTGHNDLETIQNYLNQHSAEPAFRREVGDRGLRKEFLAYYGFRGDVSMSYGSHEEWNIFRAINVRRRADPNYGFARQLAVFFDGRAVDPASMELGAAPGNAVSSCD